MEMQYFAGMTQSEIAEAIGGTSAPSDANGRRRALLRDALGGAAPDDRGR